MNERNEHYLTCAMCDYDLHACQGCGEPVTHDEWRCCRVCAAESAEVES